MPSPIAEYLVQLGFKSDDLAYKRFNEMLETAGKGFFAMGEQAKASAISVGIAVDKMASNFESLFYLSQRTGATVQSLQETAFGFSQVGLQASDAKGMIDALALSLKFNPGGTNTILSMLHVGPGDANARALGALHALRNINNPCLQSGYGEILGMNQFQLSMLLAPGALEKIESAGADKKRRQDQAGFDPDKLAENSVKFENSMRQLEDELGIVGDRIKADLITPMKTFVDLLERNGEAWAKLLGTKGAVVDPARILPGIGNAVAAAGKFLGGNLGFGLSSVNTLIGSEDSPAGRQRALAAAGLAPQAGGSSASQATREAYIRQRALVYGIDPDVAVRVARSEGLNNLADSQGGLGDHGTSGGDFQLHIGGGLGDTFRSATGRDPLDPRWWQEADDFALRQAAQGGWRPFHGAARVGIGAYEGIGASAPLGTDVPRGGGGDISVGAPNTTINVHGGADPQTTADYVLKGQLGVWDNLLRNAGTGGVKMAQPQNYAQFLRKIGLVVSPSGGGQGLDLSQMQIKFHVEGMSFDRPKSAVIRVYNLAASTQATIKNEFQSVLLQAGYQNGAYGVIFSGTILRIRTGRESAVDTFLEIMAADGDIAFNQSFVNKTLAAGATPQQKAQVSADAMKASGGITSSDLTVLAQSAASSRRRESK